MPGEQPFLLPVDSELSGQCSVCSYSDHSLKNLGLMQAIGSNHRQLHFSPLNTNLTLLV